MSVKNTLLETAFLAILHTGHGLFSKTKHPLDGPYRWTNHIVHSIETTRKKEKIYTPAKVNTKIISTYAADIFFQIPKYKKFKTN